MKTWILLSCLLPVCVVNTFSISHVGRSESKRSMKSNSVQEAKELDCIHMESVAGEFMYTSEGDSRVCGFYTIAPEDQLVELTFHDFNIACHDGGLLAFVDGWEAQGQFFPSEFDSPVTMDQRYLTYCGEHQPKRVLVASQNVALLQFRIPHKGHGFRLTLRFIPSERPCNAISMQEDGVMTLRNFGRRSNCSISVMYPEKIELLSIDVGQTREFPGLTKETGVITECLERGSQDFVELLDGNGLDSSYMWREGNVCGLLSKPALGPVYLGCQHSVIRLVSSGEYYNSLTFKHTAMTPEEREQLGPVEC